MRFFITGTAGFIGFHLARRLLEDGHTVTGYDGMTDYYDPQLKRARNAVLAGYEGFTSVQAMLEDATSLRDALDSCGPDVVVHLAGQAGVRYSIDHPESYIASNVVGTFNLIEALRSRPVRHFLFASTSSIYGGNLGFPFHETDRTDFPVSLYAATKKSCEAMSHSYAHLYGIPTTCFRFFTVYGPWGRPDMALFKFVDRIEAGEPIDVYGHGRMRRDFTYVDDLIDSIVDLVDEVPPTAPGDSQPSAPRDSLSTVAPWRVVNIAGGQPVELMDFVRAVEDAVGKEAVRNFLPMQAGDVVATEADPGLLETLTGHIPTTPVPVGVRAFVDWYREYRTTHGPVGGSPVQS